MPRYTIDFDDEFDAQLTLLAKQFKNGRKSDVIRDAIATYATLKQAQNTPNRKVSITNDDDKVVKDVILP